MKSKLFFTALSASIMLTSCATIFTGSKDDIAFTSNPEGAKVLIKGIEKCTTPCTTSVQRTLGKSTVNFELENYQSKTIELDKKFNAVTLVNILLGGVIGIGVDAATGALMKYDPKTYDVKLESK